MNRFPIYLFIGGEKAKGETRRLGVHDAIIEQISL